MDAYLMLALAEGCGPGLVTDLLEPGADPRWLIAEPPPTLPPAVRHRLVSPELARRAQRVRAEAERLGLAIWTPDCADYPARLRDAPLRPLVLFAKGDAAAAAVEHRALAVVGSRTPTPYGIAAARDFSAAVADAGVVVWSGLAYGVDATAHEAALDAGVPTVAVQAGGLDEVQPAGHTDLARRIVAGGGLLLSEAPPGLRPQRGHFPRRNRVLAAAVEAVLVVEAGIRSGTLHTARHAADAGVPVFAVPGPYTSPRSRGCHHLIEEGAHLAADPTALLRALSIETALRHRPGSAAMETSADQQDLLARLAAGPRPTDLVMRECGLDSKRFLDALFALLEARRVQRVPGDLLALTSTGLGPSELESPRPDRDPMRET